MLQFTDRLDNVLYSTDDTDVLDFIHACLTKLGTTVQPENHGVTDGWEGWSIESTDEDVYEVFGLWDEHSSSCQIPGCSCQSHWTNYVCRACGFSGKGYNRVAQHAVREHHATNGT